MIHDWKIGDRAEGCFILSNAFGKLGSNGKPFLILELQDRSGTIEGKVWDYSGPVCSANIGEVVKVTGTVSEFRGNLQLIVDSIACVELDKVENVEELVPTAPIDADASYEEILALVDSMTDEDYAGVCREMIKRHGAEFQVIPAAKSVHHGFRCGLLMHTLNMMRTADHMAALYSDIIDRNLLLAGTMLHDFAKIREFTTSALGLVTEYSMEGNLMGHLVMGAQEVAFIAAQRNMPHEKAVLLQHMLLSHHGQPEYGAAVLPQCAESELLSRIDQMDSCMEIYRETLEELPAGEFSKRLFSLEHRVYHHH